MCLERNQTGTRDEGRGEREEKGGKRDGETEKEEKGRRRGSSQWHRLWAIAAVCICSELPNVPEAARWTRILQFCPTSKLPSMYCTMLVITQALCTNMKCKFLYFWFFSGKKEGTGCPADASAIIVKSK